MPARVGGTGWHGAPSPLGIAAKPLVMGTRFSCLFAGFPPVCKNHSESRVAKAGSALGRSQRVFYHLREIRLCLRAQISHAATPQLLLEGEISLAALPAEGQRETPLTRESCEVLPVPARTSFPLSRNVPGDSRICWAKKFGICPLERAEVPLRVEDGAGDPKANVLEVFCNRIPQEN